MPRYLMDEYPVMVYPTLAEAVGLTEAVVLQKLHGWLAFYETDPSRHGDHHHDGRYWVYGTADYWAEQLPFLSSSTIRRALTDLRQLGIVLTSNYNRRKYDRTLWYAIDYEVYGSFIEGFIESKSADPLAQNEQMTSAQNEQMDLVNLGAPIPISSTTKSPTSSPTVGAQAPPSSQPTLDIIDPEETTAFSNDVDRILQTALGDEAKASGRRGPRKFDTMAQKRAWRTATDKIVAAGGTEELHKAIQWALKNGRVSRARVVATVESWARNLGKGPTSRGNVRRTKVLTNSEFAEWAKTLPA